MKKQKIILMLFVIVLLSVGTVAAANYDKVFKTDKKIKANSTTGEILVNPHTSKELVEHCHTINATSYLKNKNKIEKSPKKS